LNLQQNLQQRCTVGLLLRFGCASASIISFYLAVVNHLLTNTYKTTNRAHNPEVAGSNPAPAIGRVTPPSGSSEGGVSFLVTVPSVFRTIGPTNCSMKSRSFVVVVAEAGFSRASAVIICLHIQPCRWTGENII